MRPGGSRRNPKQTPTTRIWGFFALVLLIYGGLYIVSPRKTAEALKNCGHFASQIAIPLGLVFVFMLFINLFLSPSQIMNFLGRKAGFKGLFLSAIAGIISVGPIFAWYPLLKNLRDKGASSTILATFLCNRSVKPFLLPIMVSFFGWKYVLILTFFSVLGAMTVGVGVGVLTQKYP